MYAHNQLLFPPDSIPVVEDSRGPEWIDLVRHVKILPELHPDKLSFLPNDGALQWLSRMRNRFLSRDAWL